MEAIEPAVLWIVESAIPTSESTVKKKNPDVTSTGVFAASSALLWLAKLRKAVSVGLIGA